MKIFKYKVLVTKISMLFVKRKQAIFTMGAANIYFI